MKKLSTLYTSTLIAFFVLLIAVSASAQPPPPFCGATAIDPELTGQVTDPLPPTPTTFLPGQYLAQTFTATQSNSTGASIIVPVGFGDGVDTFVISLVEGLPSAPGAVLASGITNAIAPGAGGVAWANWGVTPLVVGNTYHITVASNGFSLAFLTTTTPDFSNDEYLGGAAWFFPFIPTPFDIYFQIEYCTDVIIPTMGQWGLILLSLLLLSFGTVQVLRRQAVLSGSTGAQTSNMRMPVFGSVPFINHLFVKALWMAGLAYAIVFAVAILGFGYEWMQADFMGIVLTLPVLAYLIHLLLAQKEA